MLDRQTTLMRRVRTSSTFRRRKGIRSGLWREKVSLTPGRSFCSKNLWHLPFQLCLSPILTSYGRWGLATAFGSYEEPTFLRFLATQFPWVEEVIGGDGTLCVVKCIICSRIEGRTHYIALKKDNSFTSTKDSGRLSKQFYARKGLWAESGM